MSKQQQVRRRRPCHARLVRTGARRPVALAWRYVCHRLTSHRRSPRRAWVASA
jgi:hypothetical protein